MICMLACTYPLPPVHCNQKRDDYSDTESGDSEEEMSQTVRRQSSFAQSNSQTISRTGYRSTFVLVDDLQVLQMLPHNVFVCTVCAKSYIYAPLICAKKNREFSEGYGNEHYEDEGEDGDAQYYNDAPVDDEDAPWLDPAMGNTMTWGAGTVSRKTLPHDDYGNSSGTLRRHASGTSGNPESGATWSRQSSTIQVQPLCYVASILRQLCDNIGLLLHYLLLECPVWCTTHHHITREDLLNWALSPAAGEDLVKEPLVQPK